MKQPPYPISLAGSELGKVRHVCAFFANDEEEYRVLLPFIREGLACGDKAVQVINPEARHEHLQRLSGAGIDSAAREKSGQLQIRINTEVYLRDGRFDQDRMLAAFEEMAASARNAEGFPMSRIVCRMDWASENQSRMHDVIEFESRVNDVWSRYDDAVICTYHLSKLSGDAVVDIMRTHPLVIIGGHLQQNPFFTPPEAFLSEFRGRRSGRTNPR
ncbi:MAG: MEDS domain-containing protein [Terracidiphilus sp.]